MRFGGVELNVNIHIYIDIQRHTIKLRTIMKIGLNNVLGK